MRLVLFDDVGALGRLSTLRDEVRVGDLAGEGDQAFVEANTDRLEVLGLLRGRQRIQGLLPAAPGPRQQAGRLTLTGTSFWAAIRAIGPT